MIPTYKFRTCSLFFLLALAALPSHSNASNNTIAELQGNAIEQQLWHHQEWINLLHYDVNGKADDDYLSQVDDERFFNAKDGKTHSKDELLATIAAFYRTDVKDNEHPQCRFIARLEWLQKKLSINTETLPVQNCKDYKEWRDMVDADQVTLIFPAYNLNSPSSMFGHTLLRLDKKFGDNESEWLSFAVNFGAHTGDEESTTFYAYKGLTGGFPGHFVVAPYYKKIREYNRIENRDIWEYHLDLTPDETHRMISHLWELKEMNFDYFFFDENCSYRLLELLEVARPGIELTDEFIVTAIPVDTVRAVERTGMIDSVKYRASQVATLKYLFSQMEETDLDLMEEISFNISTANKESFTSLSSDRQRRIIDTSYQYLRYYAKNEEGGPETKKRSYELLSLLNTYPATKSSPTPPLPTPPEDGHRSKKFSVAGGDRLQKGYLDIGFRWAFHDLEDNTDGFLRGAQINLGNINIRVDNQQNMRLYRLDLVDIVSASPRSRFFDPLSWRIYTGLERQFTENKDVLVSHVTGGGGFSYNLWKNSEVYGMGTLRIEHNENMNSKIEPGIGALTGFLQHFDRSTARIELSGMQFDDDIYRVKSSYKHNFVISTNHSLKLMAVREWHSSINFSEFSLSYQYYF